MVKNNAINSFVSDGVEYYYHVGNKDEAAYLVQKYHYSRKCPKNILSITVTESGGLFGDAGKPIAAIVYRLPGSTWKEEVLELARLVRTDDTDIELTRLISYSLAVLKQQERYDLLISYADKTHRHHGGIYQAASWNYSGFVNAYKGNFVKIGDDVIHTRTISSALGTRSMGVIREHFSDFEVDDVTEKGKYLYWKPLNRKGTQKARRLGLERLPYPKVDRVN